MKWLFCEKYSPTGERMVLYFISFVCELITAFWFCFHVRVFGTMDEFYSMLRYTWIGSDSIGSDPGILIGSKHTFSTKSAVQKEECEQLKVFKQTED